MTISLKNNDLPANDLVYNQNGSNVILSPQQARVLKLQNHVDLSKLNPDPSTDVWKVNSTAVDATLDQAVAINSGDSAAFGGELQTSTGFFRLNIMPDAAPGHALTLMFGRTVHTLLLRKELMRRLGYKIPPIKYLSKVTIHFADTATLANMPKVDIPNQTQASSERWCIASPKLLKFDSKISCISDPTITDINTVRLQDVIAYDATPLIYNLAPQFSDEGVLAQNR